MEVLMDPKTISGLVNLGRQILAMAESAKSNQRSCGMLGSLAYSVTRIAKEMVEFYTDEGVSSSAFTFLAQLQRELKLVESLVRRAGSMSALEKFLSAAKYEKEFRESMENLKLLLAALNTANGFLAAKNASVTFRSKAASFGKSLSNLKDESAEMAFRSEISSEDQAVWIQLSKTMDRLMNQAISRDEGRQEFMHHMAKLYDADASEGSLLALFRFLNKEINKGRTEKDERVRLFNEMLLGVTVRLTLDPPDWTFCPLTGMIMKDPVNVKESPVETPIERSFAEEWFFERGNKRCPISGQDLEEVTLVADGDMDQKIKAWKLESDWVELDDGDSKKYETSDGGEAGSEAVVQDFLRLEDCMRLQDFSRDMIQAAKDGDTAAVKEFLEWGADVDARDEKRCTALIAACREGSFQTIKMLISKGANLEMKDGGFTTPLCAAISGGHLALVQHLLSNGANIEGRVLHGLTPLIEAAWLGKLEIVKELVNRCADVEAEDSQGNTALMKTCERGHVQIVKILLEKVQSSLLKSQCQKSLSLVVWRKHIVDTREKPAYEEIEKILLTCIKDPSSRGKSGWQYFGGSMFLL
ncbi:hypothetical protein BSKO_05744 [Bryopsis sp. KO-2023]|nr:hypothetical protein BSKO_05744 [Bryopsis sp. KO-2023]